MSYTFLKSLISYFMIVAVLLGPTACTANTTGTAANSYQSTSSAAQTQSPKSTIGLPPDKLKQWEDTGIFDTDNLEEASLVAGYKIVTPAFIPEGFARSSKFMIVRMGAGLPEDMKPKFLAINVDQVWTWGSDKASNFKLTQSQHGFGIDGEASVKISGQTGMRKLMPAEGNQPAKLALSWSDGNLWYSIAGTLNEHMDETTLMKIAESVGVH